jgi:hypothetical protein
VFRAGKESYVQVLYQAEGCVYTVSMIGSVIGTDGYFCTCSIIAERGAVSLYRQYTRQACRLAFFRQRYVIHTQYNIKIVTGIHGALTLAL